MFWLYCPPPPSLTFIYKMSFSLHQVLMTTYKSMTLWRLKILKSRERNCKKSNNTDCTCWKQRVGLELRYIRLRRHPRLVPTSAKIEFMVPCILTLFALRFHYCRSSLAAWGIYQHMYICTEQVTQWRWEKRPNTENVSPAYRVIGIRQLWETTSHKRVYYTLQEPVIKKTHEEQ